VAVSVVDIQVNSQSAVRNLQQVGAASKAAQAGVSGLKNAVTGLLGAFTAVTAAKFVFAKTAELESQTRSLQVLTGSAQQAKQIIQELQQLGAVTPFTSTELIDAAKRLQAFGVQANNVVETTRRLADASGATGAELQGLVTAYGQVQAKGRLQGEELLQFQERGIALQEELRKMYGMTGEEFQKALSKGQISAKAVEVALQRLTSTGGKYANGAIAQSDTLAGRFSTLQDGIEGLARGIGTALSPAIKAVLNEAIFAINTINQLIATGARAKGFGLGQGQRKDIFNQAQREAEQIVNLRRVRNPFERNRQFQELAAQRERDLIEAYGIRTGQVKPTAAAPAMAADVPRLLGGGGGGGGTTGGGRSAAQQVKEIKDITAQELELRLRLGIAQQTQNKQQEAYYTKQLSLLQISQQEIGPNERRAEILETVVRYATTLKEINEAEAKVTLPTIVERIADMAAGYGKALDFTVQLTEQQKQQKAVADGLAGTIGEGLTSSFNALIQGSEDFGTSLRRIASGVLIDIANQLLRVFVIQKAINALSGLFGGGGAVGGGFAPGVSFNPNAFSMPSLLTRAKGGSVMAGQPYLVGERGPELFMPGRSGGIAPTGSFGGGVNVVVNVDAGGTSVEGSEPNANQMGRIIGAAVQAEIVKMQRPGGLLANTR
jgi:tape measure domain-containing protein